MTHTFMHRMFQDYVCARFLVDGTDDIAEYFSTISDNSRRARIWELSCALSSDASDLLRLELKAAPSRRLESANLLASTFSQDISATHTSVAESCVAIRDALEGYSGILTKCSPADFGLPEKNLWGEFAWGVWLRPPLDAPSSSIVDLLHAVRQARMGTALEHLCTVLSESTNETVQYIGHLLKVDGEYLRLGKPDQAQFL